MADLSLRDALRTARSCDRNEGDAGAGHYPGASMAILAARGLVAAPPLAATQVHELLLLLADIGWGDLAAARIFEGHVNARWLLDAFADPVRNHFMLDEARQGRVFGVWNTDNPEAPLRLANNVLSGGKSFASGAYGVDYAIVTAETARGRIMIAAPVKGRPVDRSWWRPTGMRLSGSHIVDFSGLQVGPGNIIGQPGDYLAQPWFTGGAIRFAAAHVGAMHAVHDAFRQHLATTERAGDPHQQHRLARSAILVETGYLWLRQAALAWRAAATAGAGSHQNKLVATANAARMAVEIAALEVLELAERGVGAPGFLAPHPLERLARDLRTYLRQPAPDRALGQLGAAVAGCIWSPGETTGARERHND